jgi:hypothetical protein
LFEFRSDDKPNDLCSIVVILISAVQNGELVEVIGVAHED